MMYDYGVKPSNRFAGAVPLRRAGSHAPCRKRHEIVDASTHHAMTQTERRGSEEDVVVAEIVCASCGRRLPGDAAECIHCGSSATKGRLPPAGGADVRPETAPPIADAPPIANAPQPQRLIDHAPVVLTLLLAVMGPLALPILWASRAFSTRAKILWTVVCWIEIALLVAAAWAAVAYLIRTIEQYS